MTQTVQREIVIPQPPSRVWKAIASSDALAQWMYPNDFEPRIGHRFTFQVPGNPKVGFDGLTVNCEVIVCAPPTDDADGRLVFSWSVGGPVVNTQVSFRLERDGEGTRLFFEHAGFDLAQPHGEQAFKGAQYGWAKMLEQLKAIVAQDHS